MTVEPIALPVTWNDTELAPCSTAIAADGTAATDGLLLVMLIALLPAGAGAVKVTVSVAVSPTKICVGRAVID